MSYVILKNNRRSVKATFPTYERARQYLRKLIRQRFTPQAYELTQPGMWDSISRNPTAYGSLGYRIKALNAA